MTTSATGSTPNKTVKCQTCGADSSHGNYIFDHIKRITFEVCSRCRNRL